MNIRKGSLVRWVVASACVTVLLSGMWGPGGLGALASADQPTVPAKPPVPTRPRQPVPNPEKPGPDWQPEFRQRKTEYTIPPGIYTSLVVASPHRGSVVEATLACPTGEIKMYLEGGTFVLPLGGRDGLQLSQEAKLTVEADQVHVSMMTPSGPISIKAAKK